MKRLVEFPLEEGGSVWIEVDEQTRGGTFPASPGNIPEKAKQSFEAALHQVVPVAQSVLGKLKSMERAPTEIEVTFGFNVNAEVGAIIAAASTSANFSVLLRWTREADQSSS